MILDQKHARFQKLCRQFAETEFTKEIQDELEPMMLITQKELNTYLDKQNEDESLIPYIVYDYTSEVQFQGVVTIPVSVKLETPWQETLTFDYDYTVTQPDITAGNVVSTLKIKVNGEDYDYNPVFGDTLSFTVKMTYSYVCGDADGDGKITINDVTAIQKNLAQVPQDYFNKKAADIDGKGLDITDATSIQRYLADYGDSNNIGKTIFKDKYELPFIPA